MKLRYNIRGCPWYSRKRFPCRRRGSAPSSTSPGRWARRSAAPASPPASPPSSAPRRPGPAPARRRGRAGCENGVIVEKEAAPGMHASGRNSGVLHAGIYYAPDSLKAKSCLSGNFLMRAYCRERGLPLREPGKVIVARGEGGLPALSELMRRATANGAKVEMVDEAQLADIEPNAKTVGKGLFSHDTACADPAAVVDSLRGDLGAGGK